MLHIPNFLSENGCLLIRDCPFKNQDFAFHEIFGKFCLTDNLDETLENRPNPLLGHKMIEPLRLV